MQNNKSPGTSFFFLQTCLNFCGKSYKGLGSERVKIGPMNNCFVTPTVSHVFSMLYVSTIRISIYFLDLIPKSYDKDS